MKRLLPLASALALVVCASTRAADAPVVSDVVIEGYRRVEPDAIRSSISTKAGEPLEPRRVDEDIKAVMRLGFFSDVVVEERGDPDHPKVVFRVAEKPSVLDAKIVGNSELSTDDLKDTVLVKAGKILDLNLVKQSVKKIQDKYVEKGFYLAEVEYRLTERPDNQVSLEFVVNEHAKVQVKQIDFIGNEHLSRDALLAVMSTQEGGLLSFLTSSGTYREAVFQHDLQNLQYIYGDEGYIYAKIGKPSIALSPDRRYLYLTIRIEEGDQYRVGQIDFSGELLHDKEELRKVTRVRPGEIFARSAVGRDLVALGDIYRDVGYYSANVTPETRVDPKTRIVDLTYDVEPGKKTYWERIDIVGNTKTRDKVIRRELRVYEGELFSATELRRSKERVTALGFFETVDIKTRQGSAPDKLVAVVEVKEKSTGTFQLGAGYSSYENLLITAQISQSNFLGWGQTLSLSLSWSSIRHLGQIEFVEPYFLDTRWTFAFNLYATEGLYSTFDRKAVGGSLTWGYELAGLQDWIPWTANLEDLRLYATYTSEYVSVAQTDPNAVAIYNQYRSGATSSLRFTLLYDKRDNRLFPTRGYYSSIAAEIAPPLLAPSSVFGSQVNLFTRYTYDGRVYYPLLFGAVARAKLGLGYISSWDAAHPVSLSELYYLGGINSIRGYRMLSIGPTQALASNQQPDTRLYDTTIGGNKSVTLNLEVEVPIAEKVGIKGVVFFDMGNAFAEGQWSDPSVSLSLYKSWGFGLRWFSPIGPLRFEWGFPLNRRYDAYTRTYLDSSVDFQFTIGNFF